MKLKSMLLFVLVCTNVFVAFAQKGFTLFDGTKAAQIFVDNNEPTSLKIAATHLQNDIEMVTGVKPEVVEEKEKLEGNVIILSTSKNNNLVDNSYLNSLYQSYSMQEVKEPFGAVENALLVVGSDALGAIYGTYDISEKIGVSPLYWWCDLTPEKKSKVIITDCIATPHQPSVKYRGIFINDEEAMINWSRLTSKDKSKGAISPETYKKVFELMLRLKANTI